MRRTAILLLLAMSTWLPLWAQDNPNLETGLKPYGSFHGGDLDSVSLAGGNVVLHAPFLSFPQRGRLTLDFFLVNNTKNWVVETRSNTQGLYYVWNWNRVGPQGVGLGRDQGISMHRSRVVSNDGTGTTGAYSYQYAARTGDGSSHVMGMIAPMSMQSLDVTGIRFDLTVAGSNGSGDSGTVIDRNGIRYTLAAFIDMGQGLPSHVSEGTLARKGPWAPMVDTTTTTNTSNEVALPVSIEDPDGNQISIAGALTLPTTITDTLGRSLSFASTTDYSGCAGTPVSAINLTYPAPGGGTATVKFCYQNYTLSTAFNLTLQTGSGPKGVMESGNLTQPFLNTIVLPNQTKWLFSYDSYGSLASITLPTGGTITYQYASVYGCSNDATKVSRFVVSRTVNANDGSGPKTWSYAWGPPTTSAVWGVAAGSGQVSYSNTVTDPDGNDTVHVLSPVIANTCALYEVGTQYFQGSASGGVLLKGVQTQYSAQILDSAINVVPTSITTTWPGGKTSQVTKSYDSNVFYGSGGYDYIAGTSDFNASTPMPLVYGNVLQETESDYGQGGPGPVVRKNVNTMLWQNDSSYQNLGLNMLDLPASSVVQDGSGNRVAQTAYQYDQGTPAASGVSTQHDPAPIADGHRGHLTSSSHWLNTTGAFLTSTSAYLDTGMVQSSTDPSGHITSYTYSPAFAGAYATQVQAPTTGTVQHIVSHNYDFNTGLPLSTTDENGNPTTFAYDVMSRLIQENYPDGGQVSFAYSDALPSPSVTVTAKLDATHNVTSIARVDGLGRLMQTQLTSDPEGTVYVDTTYDNRGHKRTVSNPYRSTSEATYGLTTYQYDGLGRVTKVIPPDGTSGANNVVTVYADNVVTVTDQAGKTRRSTSDALGRLVQVDEPGGSGVDTPASGSVNLSGTLQSSTSNSGGTSGTGSVSLSGTEQSASIETCNDFTPPTCTTRTVYDTGTVSVTVSGFTKSVNYGQSSTASGLASALASAFNGDTASPATASASGATVTLTAKATGTASNYTLSATSATGDPDDFGGPSFAATRSGATLTGGTNGTTSTTYDAGTVWISVNGYLASVSYGQGSTASTLASGLAQAFNGSVSSPVTASVAGSSVNLASKAAGAGSNYTLSAGSSTSLPAVFPQPSFTTTPSGGALSGGTDGLTMTTAASTYYSYDTLGNLVRVEQHGNSTSAADWRVRSFVYDSLSRLLSASNPESGTISYSYDADGNLLSKTAPAPNQTGAATFVVTYSYDALHRLTGKIYSSGDAAVSYLYDQGSYNGLSISNGKGRRTGMSDASGATAWSYDAMGRALSERRTIAGVTKSTTYTYNLDGSLATLGYPSGRTISYSYNGAGRTLSAVDTANGINYATAATYAPQGALAGAKYGASGTFAGITLANSYNQRLQPLTLAASAPSQTLLSRTYGFGLGTADNGNVQYILNNLDQSRSQAFTYDELNRVKTAGSEASWGEAFGYDPWGNLLGIQVTQGTAESLTVSVTPTDGSPSKNQIAGYCYDAAGNLLDQGACGSVHTYVYDAENRLASTAGVSYSYDGDGKRVAKSTGKLYWTGTGSDPLDESDAAGTVNEEYVFFNGKRVARVDLPAGTAHYYFSDHLGSASVVTSATGVVEQESDYYPFGGERVITAGPNNYKFTGKERDGESGLDYFEARHYSSALGRFVQPDEFSGGPVDLFDDDDPASSSALPYADITDPQSLNKYTYTYNNPLRYTDPNGHCPFCEVLEEAVTAVASNPKVVDAALKGVAAATAMDGAAGAAVEAETVVASGAIGLAVTAYLMSPGSGGGNNKNDTVQSHESEQPPEPQAASGGQGTIYRVPGSGTPSGKGYIGRHNKPDPAKTRRSSDGRDRTKARVIDKYNATSRQEGRVKEQKAIDKAGGIKKLDNKRNEIRKPKTKEKD